MIRAHATSCLCCSLDFVTVGICTACGRFIADTKDLACLLKCWLNSRYDMRISGRTLLDAVSSLSPYRGYCTGVSAALYKLLTRA